MKRFILLATILALLLCLCSCNSTYQTNSTKNEISSSAQQNTEPSYYGTWEITGLSSFSNDPSNTTIKITKSGITIKGDGETTGPLEYIENSDSYYTYLEIQDESLPITLIQINEDMMGIFWSTSQVGSGSYTAQTPQGMEINAEINILNICMRKGAGAANLPSSFDLNQMVSGTEWENYEEYIYYPNASILQLYGYGFSTFYIDQHGNAEYVEAIALKNLSSSSYYQSDIFTDSNFVITENK